MFIGPEEIEGAYEVYDFNLISIKRLARDFSDFGIILNRGWMISKYFNEEQIKWEIEYIIKKSIDKSDEIAYKNIAMFLRREEQ